MLNGCDVSLWQDDNSTAQMMDFSKSIKAGANFVFIKVSQACWLDPDYILNWRHASDAGLPKGGYHFYDWSRTPLDQAKFFANTLKNEVGELNPVLDYEMSTGIPDRNTAVSYIKTFVKEVENILGKSVIMYTSNGFWGQHGDMVDTDGFWAKHKLWIAQYTTASVPNVPKPWKTWQFWQWTSQADGKAYGAESEYLDLNWYYSDAVQFKKDFGCDVPTVHPPVVIPETVTVVAPNGLYIRTSANTSAGSLGLLYPGTKFVVDEQIVDGSNVWLKGKVEGYIAQKYNGQILAK